MFGITVERNERAKVWHARIDGISGFAGTASTLPSLLHQLAHAIPDLADQHAKVGWLDWHEATLPVHMRGDYW